MNIIQDSHFKHVTPSRQDIAAGRAFEKKVLAETPTQNNRALIRRMQENPKRASTRSVLTRLKDLLPNTASMTNPASAACAKEFIEGALNHVETKEHNQRMVEMVTAAMGDDREAKAALGKVISVNVGNLIRASGSWIQWYDQVTLKEDEIPYVRNYVPQTGNFRQGTETGISAVKHVQPNLEDDTLVDLFFLLSDVFVATLFDRYKGNIAAAGLATIDLALDLMEKIDGILQLPFTVGTTGSVYVSSFTVDGTAAAHYLASSRIDTGNFPAGNIIAPISNGGATKPRLDCIRSIDEYLGRFGNVLEGDGAITIHVASKIAHQFGDEFVATSAVNAYTDKLFKNRRMIEFNGKVYEIVADPTIANTSKYLYCKGSSAAGVYFDKPAGALVDRKEDAMLNEVRTFERALMGWIIPNTYVPRALAIQFKD